MARASEGDERIVRLPVMHDAMTSDNPEYLVSRERGPGKVPAFAHDSHLRQ